MLNMLYLGINSETTTRVVLSETNRTSLIKKNIEKMIRHWVHIEDSASPVNQDALKKRVTKKT